MSVRSSPCPSAQSEATDTSKLWLDRIIKQLGQGTFGKVVEAQDLQSPARYALKIM